MKTWPWWFKHSQQSVGNGPRSTNISYQPLAQSEVNATVESSTEDASMKGSFRVTNNQQFESYEELVGSKSNGKFKKGLIIAAVLAIVIGLSVAAVYYLNQKHDDSTLPNGASIQLSDFLEYKLYPMMNNATWASPNELTYRDGDGNIVKFNIETKVKEVLASVANPIINIAYTYDLSPDGKYMLIGRDFQKIFRHSTVAFYDIIDLQTNEINTVIVDKVEEPLLLAQWGPVGNSLLFVKNRDIYYRPSAFADDTRITSDGGENIFNGISDWVYEEEVFSGRPTLWLSPDGKKLSYLRFDDTPVRRINIPIYGIAGAPDFQYPADLPVNYPKSGSPNPTVKLFVVDLNDLKPDPNSVPVKKEIKVPRLFAKEDHIISVVKWISNDTLLAVWMNRVQNRAHLQTCTDDDCKPIYTMSSTTGWVDFFKDPFVSADGQKLLFIEPKKQSNGDSYRHLSLLSNGVTKPLTSGLYVVLDILKWDPITNYVFYTANSVNASHVQHVYIIKAEEDENKREPYCITCTINQGNIPQTYFSASVSPDAKHLIIVNEGPSIPQTDIVEWNIVNSTLVLKHKFTWEQNNKLRTFLQNRTSPVIQHHRIPLGNGFDAAIKLQLPPNADLSGKTKYPLLIEVYAGPGSYAGSDRFDRGFSSYLVTNRSYVYAQINGRGSGKRSEQLLHTIYRHMGTVEIEDQITAAKLLPEKFPFIDASRIGIWGWSYGGYAAGMALAKDNSSIFKCATSVAPVTDWMYYDSIYTERYMGLPTPEDNIKGYDQSRLSTIPKSFRNKNYLLIHGSLDDNVHFQQAMALARTLELADIPFQQITYPDEDHALGGVRKHLYHAIDKFFKKCYQGTIDL